MAAGVSVIVPTYDGQRWLPVCLAALARQTFRDFEVVVVDDRAGEATRGFENGYLGLTLSRIVNDRTRQFAACANRGVAATHSPWVALLNDDTAPEPGWLTALIAASAGAHVGSVASRMVFASRPNILQSAGICVDRAAIAWDRLRGRPVAEAAAPAEVFGPSAGAALYRRAMLDEIGLFDERFEAYLEDVDLAWRARRAGWRCRYAPDAVVRHVTSATAGEESDYKKRRLGRNKVWLAARNCRRRDLPIVAAYDLAAVAYTLVARRDSAPLRARLAGLRGWREVWRSRRGPFPALPFDPLVAPWRVPGRMQGQG